MKYTYEIKTIPDDATISMTYTKEEEEEQEIDVGSCYVRVDSDTNVSWKVYKDGYTSSSGTKKVTDNITETKQITRKPYAFMVKVDPADALVSLKTNEEDRDKSGEGTQVIQCDANETIRYTVSKDGYGTVSGSEVITSNKIKPVTLTQTKATVSVTAYPSDATVVLTYGSQTVEEEGYASMEVDISQGAVTVNYEVSCEEYTTKSGTVTTKTGQKDASVCEYVSLVSNKVMLEIDPTPSDATVFLVPICDEWVANKHYTVGNCVTYNEVIYICQAQDTNKATFNAPDFIAYEKSSGETIDNWEANKEYTRGVKVLYNSLSYICNTDKCKKATFNAPDFTAYTEETSSGNKIVVSPNTKIHYVVSKTNYNQASGDIVVTDNITKEVILTSHPKLTIKTNVYSPDIVFFTDNNIEPASDNELIAPAGTSVTYAVSKGSYYTEVGALILEKDTTIDVELVREITVTISAFPEEATITMTSGALRVSGTNKQTLKVSKDSKIAYVVALDGYVSKEGEITADSSRTIWTTLSQDATITIIPNPEEAKVTLTATGYKQSGNSITVPPGTQVDYDVSLQGYKSVSGQLVANTSKDKEVSLSLDIRLLEQEEWDALEELEQLNYVVYNPSMSDAAMGVFVTNVNKLIGMINGFTDAYEPLKLLPEDLNKLPSAQIVSTLQAIMTPLNAAISTINGLTSTPIIGTLASPVVDAINGLIKVISILLQLIIMAYNGSALWLDALIKTYQSIDIDQWKEQFNVGITPGLNSSFDDINSVDFPDDEIANDVKTNAAAIKNELGNVTSVLTTIDTYKAVMDSITPLKFDNLCMQVKNLIDIFGLIDVTPFSLAITNGQFLDPTAMSAKMQAKLKKMLQIKRKYIHKDDIRKLEELKAKRAEEKEEDDEED